MKKIIAFILTAMMVLGFAVSVNAAPVATGLNMSFVEDENGIITATFSVVGIEDLVGIQPSIKWDTTKVKLLKKDKVTAAGTSATYAECVEELTAWSSGVQSGLTLFADKAKITFNRGGTDKTIYLNCTTSTDLIKVYFKKEDGQTIDDATFDFYKKSGIGSYETQYTYGSNVTIKNSANTAKFNIAVTPYVAPAGERWQDTISDTTTGDIKFPTTSDEIGKETITGSEPAKKVVVFAKNTSENALVGTATGTANYGITVGRSYYPGYLDVPVGSNWCIMLVDPNGTLLNGTYEVSVTVDGVTQTTTARTFGE